MKRKQIVLVFLIVCILGFLLFIPKTKQKETKTSTKKKTTISYYHKEYKERYNNYQKSHPDLTKKEVYTLVNMNRDYDFYQKIIKQGNPNALNTLVNKYYQLDENYEPSDLVEINTSPGTYGTPYRKHTARKVVYNDFKTSLHQ